MIVRRSQISRLLSFICMVIIAAALIPSKAFAADSNPGVVYIADSADLLSDSEEQELYEVMKDGAEYGNMVFVTIDDAVGYDSKDYIEMLYQTSDQLKGTDAVIYMIDMDNRLLWITGYGALKKTISPDYANLITDNVYKYATDGNYAKAAITGFKQIVDRLGGSRLSGSLRTAGNFSIAVILAAVLCFLFAYVTSVSKKAKDEDVLANIERYINMSNPSIVHTTTQRIYDPPSSSSGGGGGSRGGGGGGGGFHGGGGGHGF